MDWQKLANEAPVVAALIGALFFVLRRLEAALTAHTAAVLTMNERLLSVQSMLGRLLDKLKIGREEEREKDANGS